MFNYSTANTPPPTSKTISETTNSLYCNFDILTQIYINMKYKTWPTCTEYHNNLLASDIMHVIHNVSECKFKYSSWTLHFL